VSAATARPVSITWAPSITIRIPDDLDLALQRHSTALGISKSDLARESLKRYLRVTEFRSLRTQLVARAQASGINTDFDPHWRGLEDGPGRGLWTFPDDYPDRVGAAVYHAAPELRRTQPE